MFIVEPYALVAGVQLLPEGNGKLVNTDVLDDPFPVLFEALQSQDSASEHLPHPPEEEVVLRSRFHK